MKKKFVQPWGDARSAICDYCGGDPIPVDIDKHNKKITFFSVARKDRSFSHLMSDGSWKFMLTDEDYHPVSPEIMWVCIDCLEKIQDEHET